MQLIDKLLTVCFLLASQVNVFISGQVDPYIIGGEDAKYIPHPWMVSIYFGCLDSCQPQERCEYMRCGGTLISQQWVLTAAHCIEGTFENLRYFQVFVGDYDFTKDNERNERHMAVEQIIQHEEYIHTTTRVENDIALIKLKEPVQETPETKCLRLARNKSNLKDDCHLFGWGEARQNDGNACTKSPTLKSVDLKNVDLDKCREYYHDYTIYDKNVCAGGEKGQGACFGDSGGGLFCSIYNDDIYSLLGIASWTMTNPCASQDKPTVFTDVTEFRDWINENCERCLDNYNEKHCENSINIRPIIPDKTTTTTNPEPTNTSPIPWGSCRYPSPPLPGATFICHPFTEDDPFIPSGTACYLRCENGQFAGSEVCMKNGEFDKSQLETWKCYPETDCALENSDYNGHDLNDVDDVETWMECGVLCKDQQRCTHWTLNVNNRRCFLKKGHNYGEPTWNEDAISGERDCP